MFDNSLLYYAKEHYELRVKAEERAWRHRQLMQDPPGFAHHALARLGAALVNTGQQLQRREVAEMGRV
jgi:hypothetical protein